MSDRVTRRLMITALIAVLHLPLIYQASSVHLGLAPGQDIAELGPVTLFSLLLLFLLPHAALALFRIEWNPERARLGEYDC